jgi:hypothetical protein
MNELETIAIICGFLNGEPEVSFKYEIDQGNHRIQVDCVTDTHVVEVGLDTRSSLDSVQQAAFAGWLSDKEPMVIIVDRDGIIGPIEYRIRTASQQFGVEYRSMSADFLLRWQMTSYFRQKGSLDQ